MDLTTSGARFVEELVRRHQASVRGFLLFLGCPPHLADDLVQDVFLAFLSSHFEHRADAATAAFLRKVARHLYLKAMERERRAPMLIDLEEAENVWLRFEGEDGGQGYLSALRECVERLRGRPADVIRLRYEDGWQRDRIGEVLGITDSGVKAILIRTRAMLKECVERRLAS